MTHGAGALQTNGVYFGFIPRKVPKLDIHHAKALKQGGVND